MNDRINGVPFLEGQPNFRGLEWIKKTDGKRFRKNMVYRSGSLHNLSGSDIQKLEKIGLSVVIDFRSDREIEFQPSCKVSTVKETLRITIPDLARDMALNFLEMNDAEGLDKLLVSDYRRMIRDDSSGFRKFFRILEQAEEFPLVYHCAAGKDRTGIASVLLLTALGVDMETVRKDYFFSNDKLKAYADKLIRKVTENGKNGEILRPMMEVRPEYLQAAFDEIDQSFGGMKNYLGRILDIDIELLKNKYLE